MQDIREAMEHSAIKKEDLLDYARRLDDFAAIRFIRLSVLPEKDWPPPATEKTFLKFKPRGKIVGLRTTTGHK